MLRDRALVALVTVCLAATASGCEPEEEEPADPQAGYEQPPNDLCERIGFEDVLQRWELSVPSWSEPGADYDAGGSDWYVRCSFAGVAEDGRFATEIEDFRARGAVSLSIYHDVKDAVDNYDQTARGHVGRQAERVPAATTAEVTGWWDTGVSLELPEELDPDDYVLGDFEITSVAVEWLVRHENLVARADASALSPTGETAEAAALLHDLVAALLDESVEHLTLTTE